MRHFFCEKAVKNEIFEKTIEVGSVLVWTKNMITNVLVVVVTAVYFAEVPEEVLVKMTKGKSETGVKKQFLGVYMTSEKTGRKCKI